MYFVFSFRFTFQGKILHDLQSLPILGQPSNARWCDTRCDIKPGRVKLHDRWNGIIWPWDMLSHLWNKKSDHSDFFLWAHDPKEEVQQKCADYWMHVSHLDFFKKLGITDLQATIPVAWHMDGVKVYKTHKAYVYSMASSLKKGNSLESKLLTLLFLDTYMKKPFTHDAAGKVIGYIMEVLQSGVFASKDFDGTEFPKGSTEASKAGTYFCGGFTCAFSCFKADLEARVMAHKLSSNWAADYICERCPATKLPGPNCYGNFSNSAAYLQCCFSHREFLLLNGVAKQSSWVNVRGWDIDRNLDDSLWKCHQSFSPSSVLTPIWDKHVVGSIQMNVNNFVGRWT